MKGQKLAQWNQVPGWRSSAAGGGPGPDIRPGAL